MNGKLKRDAIALVVLSHPDVDFSVSAAARMAGASRQRWHQRLRCIIGHGWAVKGPQGVFMTPRGSEVRDEVLRPLTALSEAGREVDLGELLAGPWSSMFKNVQG